VPDAKLIPFQPNLPKNLPTIEGNVDYRLLREQLHWIGQSLVDSGLECQLIEASLTRWLGQGRSASAKSIQNHQIHCRRALRCNIARLLLGEDYRGFAARLADSPLLQHFCGLDELDRVKVPAKSTLQRYDAWWPEEEVRMRICALLGQGSAQPETLHLPQGVDLDHLFIDSTCLEVNIHYPVDWVLLRDGTRTLMRALILIRKQGLKHRMESPESFLSRINKLCIEMTHAGAKSDGPRHRKKILRKMDRLVGVVRAHARRYRQMLDQQWQQTEWTRPQTEQVLQRMDRVIELLPKARAQARQRILEEKQVPNAEKILSLYEQDVHVIVRGKAGRDVEFGNTLLIAENPQGLILDWKLFQGRAPSDTGLLPGSVGRMERAYGRTPKAVAADRGFDCQANQAGLKLDKIYNAICPRDPRELGRRLRLPKFKRLQRRRAQTEARVAILKNVFMGGRLLCKGFEARARTVTWTVLVHNLWVLARLQREHAAEQARLAAQQARLAAA
jgi:hypothetical protein